MDRKVYFVHVCADDVFSAVTSVPAVLCMRASERAPTPVGPWRARSKVNARFGYHDVDSHVGKHVLCAVCNAMQCAAETELPPRSDLSRFDAERDASESAGAAPCTAVGVVSNRHTHARARTRSNRRTSRPVVRASASVWFVGVVLCGRIHGLQTGMLAAVRYLEG